MVSPGPVRAGDSGGQFRSIDRSQPPIRRHPRALGMPPEPQSGSNPRRAGLGWRGLWRMPQDFGQEGKGAVSDLSNERRSDAAARLNHPGTHGRRSGASSHGKGSGTTSIGRAAAARDVAHAPRHPRAHGSALRFHNNRRARVLVAASPSFGASSATSVCPPAPAFDRARLKEPKPTTTSDCACKMAGSSVPADRCPCQAIASINRSTRPIDRDRALRPTSHSNGPAATRRSNNQQAPPHTSPRPTNITQKATTRGRKAREDPCHGRAAAAAGTAGPRGPALPLEAAAKRSRAWPAGTAID